MKVILASLLCACCLTALAQSPLRSGLTPGQRPGPYSALVSVGNERGQQHCYICEAGDRPIVIIFARTLNEPLGKLVQRIDRLLPQHKDVELRAWVTFLHESHTACDPQVIKWAQQHGLRNVPVAVFEDLVGPPSYRLARAAEVTVLLSVQQKVVANFAYKAGELNEQAIEEIIKAVPRITAAK